MRTRLWQPVVLPQYEQSSLLMTTQLNKTPVLVIYAVLVAETLTGILITNFTNFKPQAVAIILMHLSSKVSEKKKLEFLLRNSCSSVKLISQ